MGTQKEDAHDRAIAAEYEKLNADGTRKDAEDDDVLDEPAPKPSEARKAMIARMKNGWKAKKGSKAIGSKKERTTAPITSPETDEEGGDEDEEDEEDDAASHDSADARGPTGAAAAARKAMVDRLKNPKPTRGPRR